MATQRQPGPRESAVPILLVDDEPVILEGLTELLSSRNWEVFTAQSAPEALRQLDGRDIPFIISDIDMPGMSGIDLLEKVKEARPEVEIIFMTGKGSEELAIQALRAGASDYFRKPIQGPEVMASLLRSQRIRAVKAHNSRLSALVSRLSGTEGDEFYFGRSKVSRELLAQIRKLAEYPTATVLLTGETGSGKEVAARVLHGLSKRRSEHFVATNCGGIAESLLERELFGHEKGAFTGAEQRTPGIFEMGLEGTVLLDEITELSLAAQSRLLRVVEARTFRRVGGTTDIDLGGTRIVATSNQPLEELVAAGVFRQDLFYRLNVVPLRVAPLRERRSEIVDLARNLLARLPDGEQYVLTPEAEDKLIAHEYPGNVRELKNVVEYAAIFCEGRVIGASDLTFARFPVPDASTGHELGRPLGYGQLNLEDLEKRAVAQAIQASPNNHSAAARSLGITPQALKRRMAKFSLQAGA